MVEEVEVSFVGWGFSWCLILWCDVLMWWCISSLVSLLLWLVMVLRMWWCLVKVWCGWFGVVEYWMWYICISW